MNEDGPKDSGESKQVEQETQNLMNEVRPGTYWIRKDGEILGPFSQSELRELTQRNELNSFVEIANDPTLWLESARIPDITTRGVRLIDETEKLPIGNYEDIHLPGSCTFPIIRVDRTWFRTLVVAILQDRIVLATHYLRRPKIDYELFDDFSPEGLRRFVDRQKEIPFVNIDTVVEKSPSLSSTREAARSGIGRSRFLLRPRKGWRSRFTLEFSQTATLRTALRELLDDRFSLVKKREPILGTILLTAITALTVLLTIFDDPKTSSLSLIVWSLCNFVLVVWRLVYKIKRRRTANRTEEIKKQQGGLLRRLTTSIRSRLSESSSVILIGVALKIVGLLFAFAVLGPWYFTIDGFVSRDLPILKLTWMPIVLLPAPLLIYLGYRLSQKPYRPKSGEDPRKPILYLRPFEDDSSSSLQPVGELASFLGIKSSYLFSNSWRNWLKQPLKISGLINLVNPVRILRLLFNIGADSSEENIVRIFEPYGPVIAIGNPQDVLPSPGAMRAYFSDESWQESVTMELRRAQAVVVQPGVSEGVRWELQQIRKTVEPKKLLLSMTNYRGDFENFEKVSTLLRNTLGVSLPNWIPFSTHPIFVWFDNDWSPNCQETSYKNPATWAVRGDATDLPYTLSPFLQGMHGGQREAPRPVRWKANWQPSYCCSVVAGIVISVVVALAPFILLRKVGLHFYPALQLESSSRGAELKGGWRTIRDKQVGYRLRIPKDLREFETSEKIVKYAWRSADIRLVVQIVESKGEEDLTYMGEFRRANHEKTTDAVVTLEASGEVKKNGTLWRESRIDLKLENGQILRELCRGMSGKGVTMLLAIIIRLEANTDDDYEVIAERILDSLTLEKP